MSLSARDEIEFWRIQALGFHKNAIDSLVALLADLSGDREPAAIWWHCRSEEFAAYGIQAAVTMQCRRAS